MIKKNQKAATGNRQKASSLLLQIIDEMPRTSENFTIISTQFNNIYRRSERLDVSIAIADELLSEDHLNNTIKAVADFCKKQAVAKNLTCFTFQDAQFCTKSYVISSQAGQHLVHSEADVKKSKTIDTDA